MNRRCRAGEVVDLVNLEEKGLDDVVPDELEPGVAEVVHHVLLPPGEEVVDDDHAVASGHQAVHQVAPDESRPARHHDPQTLPLQPQRDFPARMERPESDALLVHEPAVLVGGRSGGRDRVEAEAEAEAEAAAARRMRRRAQGDDDERGEGHPGEEANQALLAEHVTDRTVESHPRLRRLWRVGVGLRRRFLTSEEQLRSHYGGDSITQ
ncbi:hypothetical protein DM860_012689 [Cuscuta australis]|uniref:Uncharacterized protein n=1 Tax=Cuscuta australis TaxID=267555 RepID=A0A328DG63_9ASTE|nr:hypothetical protein DM860_012689 [Cuscuta australis]